MSTTTAATGERSSPGRYRLRETTHLQGTLLVCTRPLVVTRLNDSAVAVASALSTGEFRDPAAVAAETGTDPAAVADLLDALHGRGFLAWRPDRDPDYRPPVSVVVTVRNDASQLRGCLDALASLEYPDYEVVVVDDGSTDDAATAVESHPLGVRHVRVGSPEEPLGIGASRNRGVAAATHGVIAFTDADCRPRPDWLAELVPALACHDVVGGRVRPYGTDSLSAYEGVNSSLDMGPRAERVRPDSGTPYLPTANLLGHRSVFKAVGFPDRNVAEDVGFCWSALDAGHDVVYDPAGVVDHDYADSARRFVARRRSYGASEALLATEFSTTGTVPVSPVAALSVVAAAVALLVAVVPGLAPLPVAVGAALATGMLVAVAGAGWSAWRAYRRAEGAVSADAVLASTRRGALSTAYSVTREINRYYAIPLGILAISVVGAALVAGSAGSATAVLSGGLVLCGVVLVAVLFPAVVEFAVQRPATSPTAYLRWYLLDHLAYQWGVYEGAIDHRTVAHLDPRRRFSLGRSR